MNIEQEFVDVLLLNKHVIYKVCFMYGKDRDDINDMYQEVIFNLWKSYKDFSGKSMISTWIYRVALNTCITNLRKRKNYNYVPLEQNIDIIDDCEHDELLKEMYMLVKMLNARDRMFIILWLDGKTYDEISDITGTSRNNVAIRLYRIKEKLKNMSNL